MVDSNVQLKNAVGLPVQLIPNSQQHISSVFLNVPGFLVNDDVTAPSIENQQQNDEATSMVRGIGTERFGNEMDYQQGTGQIVRRLRKEAFAGDQLLTVAEKEILRKWFKSKTSACICNRKVKELL